MIVNNGGLLMQLKVTEATTTVSKTDGTSVNLTVSNSQYLFKKSSRNNNQDTVSSASAGGMVMDLGVGTTPESPQDVWLDETEVNGVNVNSVIQCTATTGPIALPNGNIGYFYDFYNSSLDTSYTITELGLSFVGTTGKFLYGRKLVPARVIPPEGTATFVYEIALNGRIST